MSPQQAVIYSHTQKIHPQHTRVAYTQSYSDIHTLTTHHTNSNIQYVNGGNKVILGQELSFGEKDDIVEALRH